MLEDTRNYGKKDLLMRCALCHQNMLISTVLTVVTIVGQDAAGNHERVPISPISPKGEVPKP